MTDTHSASIVCDGKGGVRIYYPPGYVRKQQDPCIANCIDAHENCHKVKALNENPDVCKGQLDGTRIESDSYEQKYEDEVSCAQVQLDCLHDDPACMRCPASLVASEVNKLKRYQDDNNTKLRKRTGKALY